MAVVEEIKVPLLAVNDTSLTVVELSRSPGSKVVKGDQLMVFETSKTTYDVEAQSDGFVQYYCVAGEDYEVNAIVARIYSEEAEALAAVPVVAGGSTGASFASTSTTSFAASSTPSFAAGPPAAAAFTHQTAFASQPLARWEGETLFSREAVGLIETHGLDKGLFRGRDLVSASDVLQVIHPAGAPAAAAHAAPSQIAPTTACQVKPTPSAAIDPLKATAEKLSTAKRREIEYLGEVQQAGLTSTIHTFVETDGIFIHINRGLRYLKDSLLPVILYESSRLLVDYPQLNAWFTGDAIARYIEINPGFAIDIDRGLKVARVAGAGEKSLQEIETAILALSGDYLDDKLKLEDITGITFTITDLSAEGVAFFQPLINKMNSAILGVSAIDVKMQRCTLSLTFDHRVTEGKTAARFLKELKERLESYRPAGGVVKKDIACFKCYKTLAEDLGGAGFVHCITPEGKEGYICQSCLKGF